MENSEQRIKIAVQKSGRLTDHSIDLLERCGLKVTKSKDQLICYGENMPIDLLLVRDDDIPGIVDDHIGKRLGIPCAVISAPVHVQDFPARYSPQMGWEGANVIFDTWIHPLVMGLEEHLLAMFREDFEFNDESGPSHHGCHAQKPVAAAATTVDVQPTAHEDLTTGSDVTVWLADAEKELKKIPFFVRGKAKRNTEKFAADNGVTEISVDTLYEAKAHYAR